MRLKIIRIVIIGLFAVIVCGLFSVQVIHGLSYQRLSKNNRIRVVPVEGRRGTIFDRHGTVIAGNRLSFDVMVVPQEVADHSALFAYVASVLGIDQENLEKTFQQKMIAPFAPVVVAQDIKRGYALELEENKFRFPGLLVRAGSRRHYPFKEINAHVVGYIGSVNRSRATQLKEYGYIVPAVTGYSGVEEYYDSYLAGEDGGLQVEINSRGQQVRLLGSKESYSGEDLTVTIDNKIQQMATRALGNDRGAIVAMEFETGEILAMVSTPSFDPNIFVGGNNDRKIASFLSDSHAPLFNRAISGQYPPGSTFKVPLAVCALAKNKITRYTSFPCVGYYQLGRRQFRCSHTHGIQNLTEGIAHSCNVYFYNVGLILGPDAMTECAQLFGFGRLTNIDLPHEKEGLVPGQRQKRAARKEKWYDGDTLNFAIGQGDVLVTPLQLVSMMATVAHNGRLAQPHVIKAIGGQEVDRYVSEREYGISKKTFDAVIAGLKAAVGDYAGTAHLLDIKGVTVAGKTGTAQTSGDKETHAWFVGFCPSAETKIAFCVFLEHGGSSYHACQVARQLLLEMRKEDML